MKILTAFVTVLALLGFGGVAFAACDGMGHQTTRPAGRRAAGLAAGRPELTGTQMP